MYTETKKNSSSLFILGSCVSRDIINFDNRNNFSLLDYYARSSFASAFGSSSIHDVYSENLNSPFQRKIVHADLTKKLENIIEKSQFDYLLIDLIDERFDIFVFQSGAVCTVSNEAVAAGLECLPDNGRIVKSGSEEFFRLWEGGGSRFVGILKKLGKLASLRVNRVYWAEKTESGGDFSPHYSLRGISDSNKFLNRMYERIRLDIEDSQFLCFEKN